MLYWIMSHFIQISDNLPRYHCEARVVDPSKLVDSETRQNRVSHFVIPLYGWRGEGMDANRMIVRVDAPVAFVL